MDSFSDVDGWEFVSVDEINDDYDVKIFAIAQKYKIDFEFDGNFDIELLNDI